MSHQVLKQPHPPRAAARLVKRMFPDRGGCSILGDMIETYRCLAEEKNLFSARIWFWMQCLKALPAFIGENLYGRKTLFKNYLFVAVRNLRKNSMYSLLNILGLTVGLTAFILIALYVQYELSFDKYHENSGRIYRVVRENRAFTPAPLGPALKESFPEVEAAARLLQSQKVLISHENENFLEEEFYWADPGILQIFSLPLVHGDPETALTDPNSVLLSEKTALKYFGNQDPVGKTLTISERADFQVTGVFYDMPRNSHFVMDIVVPYETYFVYTDNSLTNWRSNFSYTYILLSEGADAEELDAKIAPVIERPLLIEAGVKEPYPRFYYLQPLTDIHLRSHRMQEISVNNDIKYILLFSSVAFLILMIAGINYMNLATARSIRRGREVGMRKVVGAQRKQLVTQFLGESVTVAVLAMLLSMVMIILTLPAFNSLVERPLGFNPVKNPLLFLGLFLITLLVGLSAGAYPALSLSGFKPASVLSGVFTRSPKGSTLRSILVLAQFAITIILIACTLTVGRQLNYVKNRDVGYDKDQVLILPIRDRQVLRNIEPLKTELLRHANITAAAASDRLPNDIDTFTSRNWTGRDLDEPISIFYNTADYDFVELFGMEIVQGRNFSKEFPSDEKGAFLVNETAVKIAGWENPIGREFRHWRGDTGTIVGVLKDFHLQSLHRPIEPLYIFLEPSDFSYLSIKINATDIPASISYVEKVMKKFSPHYPFDFSFFDEMFERAYFTEQRIGRVFSSFSILAIFVACLGLFGLAAFAAEQRTKEIGIRKVLGAPVSIIVLLLSKEFLRWVILANLIAWPAAYFAMNKWLQNFAYRVPVGIAVFLISGFAALLIASLTVSFQSVKAARSNPLKSLRYE